MKAAYADPPYKGQAKKHYAHDPRCAEVDHARLIWRLTRFNAWALSCKSNALELEVLLGHARRSLELRGKDTERLRLGMWFKPFCSFKPGVGVAYAFEPVIWWSSRARAREQDTVRDWVEEWEEAPAVKANITLRKGLSGVKPPKFSRWLFEVLNLTPEDEFLDLFPGSGAVMEAWQAWRANRELAPAQLGLCASGGLF